MTTRVLELNSRFDLARTTAPVWWAHGRWPNVDWRDDTLHWVGWEGGQVVWRSVRQRDSGSLTIVGTAGEDRDADWACLVLGSDAEPPTFTDPVLNDLALNHSGMRPWAAGSLYEGFVSAIVGQSISVAAAAVTEGRLYALLNDGHEIAGRMFWPPPRSQQLAATESKLLRQCGVTQVRAEALIAVGSVFSALDRDDGTLDAETARTRAEQMLSIRGVGRWSVESALLWGLGDPDAHPTGDVALLRAARQHWPDMANLKELDRRAEDWRPNRAWAARILWLDLLGFAGSRDRPVR